MSLLEILKLPPAPIQPQKIMNITDSQGVEVGKNGARPIAVKAAETPDLRARLDTKARVLRDAYAKLAQHQPRLEAAIATASGDTKKTMELQKADVDKHIASIERQLVSLDTDRKALDDPRTDAKAMNDILARSKSTDKVGTAVEVDRHDDPVEKKRTENRTTTTTTSLEDGKSTTRVKDETTKVGLTGASREKVDSKQVVTGSDTTTTSLTRTDKISKEGLSRETVKKRESEQGGEKSSIEKKDGLKVGPDGIASSHERTATKADGSSVSDGKTTKLERGDGKLGLARTSSQSKTDALGNETKTETTAKGGIKSGKDGIGAYGEGERSMERTSASGLKTGAVVGLNGNVTCNVKLLKAAEGTQPAQYMLVTRIDLGASASVSASRGKDDSDAKTGVKASASATVFMERQRPLAEQEAAGYVAALKSGSGTQEEFQIIRTGLSKGWPAARDMYLAMSGKTGSASDVDGMQAGESKEVGKKLKGGVSASVDVKGIGVQVGVDKTHDQSMKVTKEKDGSASYETNIGDGTTATHGGKVSVGVVEGSFTASTSVTTSRGYKLSVKPGMKNARQLQDQIARLSSQAEIDQFAKDHKDLVDERTDTTGTENKQAVGVGIGGAKVGLKYGSGIEESKTTDRSGKVIGTQTKGKNTGGMDIGLGKLKIGASTDEEAVAKTDADGETTLDVTRTDTSTDMAKMLGGLPVIGDKKDKKKGALATATGGDEPDNDTHDVSIISLKGGDLQWLAETAGKDMNAWMKACNDPQLRDAWRAAANEVRKAGGGKDAVAKALARFIGGDTGRAKVVNAIVRPAGDTSSGMRSEFPQSIGSRKGEYAELVIKDCEKQVTAAGKGDLDKGQQVGKDLLARLQSLYNGVNSASDFSEPAVQGEMLSAIGRRQGKVQVAIRTLGGPIDPAEEKKQLQADYQRLLEACIRHQQIQNDCFDKIEAEYHKRWSKEDAIVIATLIKQIRDLHATWTRDYKDMAVLAQENDWGKDTYWKYKPDVDRFNNAIKGHPGKPSEAKRETVDMRRSPDAVSEKAKGEMNQQADSARYKRYQQTKLGVETTRTHAQQLGNELQALMKKKPSAAAAKLVGKAEWLFEDADIKVRKCRPNYMEDMEDFGAPALEQFRQAVALLNQAQALLKK